MAKIVITRPNDFSSKFRRFQIFIDGIETGSIKNDSTEEFNVSTGLHKVVSKISFYSSNTYEVMVKKEHDVIFLAVKNRINFLWIYIPFLLVLLLPILLSDREPAWYF